MTPSKPNESDQAAAAEAKRQEEEAAAAAAAAPAPPKKGDKVKVRYLDQGPTNRVANAKVLKVHNGKEQKLDLEVYRPPAEPMQMEGVARSVTGTDMGWFYA